MSTVTSYETFLKARERKQQQHLAGNSDAIVSLPPTEIFAPVMARIATTDQHLSVELNVAGFLATLRDADVQALIMVGSWAASDLVEWADEHDPQVAQLVDYVKFTAATEFETFVQVSIDVAQVRRWVSVHRRHLARGLMGRA